MDSQPCHGPAWGEVCGPWAITMPYWVDGGYQGGGEDGERFEITVLIVYVFEEIHT